MLVPIPGGWCQVVAEKIKNGKFYQLIKKIEEIKGVKFIIGDFLEKILKTS